MSTVMCSGGQRLVAPDEPTSGKSIASDHLMVLLSAALAQWLVCCLGLFIPLPPSPFEVVGLCGSAEECKKPRRPYPIHPSAKLLIHRLAHALCVCLVLGLA
jgi:hypothetical protein